MSNEMDDWQSLEKYREGLKRAASACYDMSCAKKSSHWAEMGKQLHVLRQIGEKLYQSHAMSRWQVLAQAEEAQRRLKKND